MHTNWCVYIWMSGHVPFSWGCSTQHPNPSHQIPRWWRAVLFIQQFSCGYGETVHRARKSSLKLRGVGKSETSHWRMSTVKSYANAAQLTDKGYHMRKYPSWSGMSCASSRDSCQNPPWASCRWKSASPIRMLPALLATSRWVLKPKFDHKDEQSHHVDRSVRQYSWGKVMVYRRNAILKICIRYRGRAAVVENATHTSLACFTRPNAAPLCWCKALCLFGSAKKSKPHLG